VGPNFRLFAISGTASLAAIGAGAAAAALTGYAAGAWALNAAAWVSGFVLALAITRWGTSRAFAIAVLAIAGAGLAATLALPGQQGVHRWLDIGPLHANASALLLPAAVAALAGIGVWSLPGLAFTLAAGLLLVAQPDASQASAFLAAAALLFARSPAPPTARSAALAIAGALAALAWLRPDPLQPVAEVEGIVTLAAGASIGLAAFAVLALAGACLSPLALARPGTSRTTDPALALTAYLSACALAPLIGAFPVPLAGLGMSFPLGFWLGIGVMIAQCSSSSPAPQAAIPFARRPR